MSRGNEELKRLLKGSPARPAPQVYYERLFGTGLSKTEKARLDAAYGDGFRAGADHVIKKLEEANHGSK